MMGRKKRGTRMKLVGKEKMKATRRSRDRRMLRKEMS